MNQQQLKTEIKEITRELETYRADTPLPVDTAQTPPHPLPPTPPPRRPQPYQPEIPRFLSRQPGQAVDADWAIDLDRFQSRTAAFVQQVQHMQHLRSHPAQAAANDRFQATWKQLEQQAQYINELSTAQETALLKFKDIVRQATQDWKTQEFGNLSASDLASLDVELPTFCQYDAVAVPHLEPQDGLWRMTARSIDLFKAEREANLNAQALRHLRQEPSRSQHRPARSLAALFWRWLVPPQTPTRTVSPLSYAPEVPTMPTPAPTAAQPQTRRSSPIRVRAQKRQTGTAASTISLREALTLLTGAVLMRALLNLTLAAYPGLWVPAVALMITPAAVAVYRTNVTPQSGFVWGMRLVVILIGLLLGGRLL